MPRQVSGTDAKNNLEGLLEDVATLQRVNVVQDERLVVELPSPRPLDASLAAGVEGAQDGRWGSTHMIPAELARAARMLNSASTFDEE